MNPVAASNSTQQATLLSFARQLRFRAQSRRHYANPAVFPLPKDNKFMENQPAALISSVQTVVDESKLPQRNPRVDCSIDLQVGVKENGDHRALNFPALCFKASKYGGNIAVRELSQKTFLTLKQGEEITVETHIRSLPAVINSIFEMDGKYCLGIKLLNEHTWYD